MNHTPPPTDDPLADQLRWLIAETGAVELRPGGLCIKIFHMQAFPWDDVIKTLLYRDCEVRLTRSKADFFVHASLPASSR